jgi:pyruvate kinase
LKEVTMRRQRHAKIVTTLGPASSDPKMIRALFSAGADVFRFNFSHGSHSEHQARYEIVREIEKETGRPIAVLADNQLLRVEQQLGDNALFLGRAALRDQ